MSLSLSDLRMEGAAERAICKKKKKSEKIMARSHYKKDKDEPFYLTTAVHS